MAKAKFNKKRALFTSKMDLDLRKKLVKCYIWVIAVYGAENGTLRAVIRNTWKVLKCGAGEGWRRPVEVLLRVKEQKNILHEISKRKANMIGH
jgi:hypothetical protein